MKARLAKKLLKRMSVLSLQPGDTLVVTVDGLQRPEEMDRLGKTLTPVFPGTKVLVVPSSIEFAAIRPEPERR